MYQFARSPSVIGVTVSAPLLPNDIVCTKTPKYNKHSGNQLFRHVIASYANDYVQAHGKFEKIQITRAVLHTLKVEHQARFVKRDGNNWVEVSPQTSRDKVSHALRFAGRSNGETASCENRFMRHSKKRYHSSPRPSPVEPPKEISFPGEPREDFLGLRAVTEPTVTRWAPCRQSLLRCSIITLTEKVPSDDIDRRSSMSSLSSGFLEDLDSFTVEDSYDTRSNLHSEESLAVDELFDEC